MSYEEDTAVVAAAANVVAFIGRQRTPGSFRYGPALIEADKSVARGNLRRIYCRMMLTR